MLEFEEKFGIGDVVECDIGGFEGDVVSGGIYNVFF